MSAPRDDLSPREPLWLVVALTLALLATRLLAAGYGSFIENDETSLAAGIASLLRGSDGDLYRYAPQFGYYRLVEGLTRISGGDVLTIPLIQVTLSVLGGTLIPLMGLLAFRADLSRLERWFVAATLAASPILWMASRYGSSAMVSVPLALGGLVLLSNRPARGGELLALALIAAAIFVRADAVLVTPGVAVLLWRNHGRWDTALLRLAGLGLFVAAVFGFLFVADPRMRGLTGDVAKHMTNSAETMFWEYLLWSVSPFPLIFAVVGLRDLLPARRWLLAVLAAWSLPVLAFYFPATTQARYFLLTTLPLAVASAVGMASMVRLASRRRGLAVAAVVALCSVHLAVGLGRFVPGHRRSFLSEASVETQTGPLWTGAFLWKSYWSPGITNAPVFHPRFGKTNAAERSAATMFAYLASGAMRGRHVVLLQLSNYGHLMHFYAQAFGVAIVSKGDGPLFNKRFEMEIGGARLTTLGLLRQEADPESLLPVSEGDEVWFFESLSRPTRSAAARLPPGLVFAADSQLTGAPSIQRFLVVQGR